jgi:hypothetical protein
MPSASTTYTNAEIPGLPWEPAEDLATDIPPDSTCSHVPCLYTNWPLLKGNAHFLAGDPPSIAHSQCINDALEYAEGLSNAEKKAFDEAWETELDTIAGKRIWDEKERNKEFAIAEVRARMKAFTQANPSTHPDTRNDMEGVPSQK